jgi:hypothetical protein
LPRRVEIDQHDVRKIDVGTSLALQRAFGMSFAPVLVPMVDLAIATNSIRVPDTHWQHVGLIRGHFKTPTPTIAFKISEGFGAIGLPACTFEIGSRWTGN